MSNNDYTPVKIKVRLFEDKIFDAYELRNNGGKRVEWNSGGYVHPHFDKETALAVAEYYNVLYGTDYYDFRFEYDSDADTFTEIDGSDVVESVTQNQYGLYELGCDWTWDMVE